MGRTAGGLGLKRINDNHEPNDKTPDRREAEREFLLNHVRLQYTKIAPRVVKRKRNTDVTACECDRTFTLAVKE